MDVINITILRGDKDLKKFTVSGNHANRDLSFVVKADKELTSSRLIQKTNEIIKSLNIDETHIEIPLLPADTQDLPAKKYYYDLVSTNPADPTDTLTLACGIFNLQADVQTPFDGTDLPEDSKRYMPVFADLFLEGQFPRALKDGNGNLTWEGTYNIFGLLFEADANGDLQPTADVIVEDNNFELDENDDIMPV